MSTPPPDADLAALGHALAALRVERGWSLDALAERSGVSRKTIVNIEQSHKAPRAATLHALAHALDVSLGPWLNGMCHGHEPPGGGGDRSG